MKLPEWRQNLRAYLTEAHTTPFAYGSHDCMLFGAGAVQAQTGVDIAADWRGRYDTLIGGLRLILDAGYPDMATMIEAFLLQVHPAFAQEGDIALVDGAVGVVQGAFIYVLAEGGGVGIVPLTSATNAFRVE
jgi:hypothetical protein